jgi:GNAT superfamily N-acetyltransferase
VKPSPASGYAGLSDGGVDDSNEEREQYARRRPLKEGIEIRRATTPDVRKILSVYGGYWFQLRTGVDPESLVWSESEMLKSSERRRPGAPARGVLWPSVTGARQIELENHLRETVASGLTFVAVRNGELLGFLAGSLSHPQMVETTDLFVVPGARNVGVASALLSALKRRAEQQGALSLGGWHSAHYRGSLKTAEFYLEDAFGWMPTKRVASMFFEFYRPSFDFPRGCVPDWARTSHCASGQRAIRAHVRRASMRDAARISAASIANNGGRTLTTEHVVKLLQQGPACVAIDGSRQIAGYGLTSMGIPGVLEICHLDMVASSSSGEVEYEMLTDLHRRARAHGVDTAIVHRSDPWPACAPAVDAVLSRVGYAPCFSYGPSDVFTVDAYPLVDDGPSWPTILRRYQVDREDDLYETMGSGSHSPMMFPAPTVVDERNLVRRDYREVGPLLRSDLRDPEIIARLSNVAFLPYDMPFANDLAPVTHEPLIAFGPSV